MGTTLSTLVMNSGEIELATDRVDLRVALDAVSCANFGLVV